MIWFGLSFKDKIEGTKIMKFNDNNDDDDDTVITIIIMIIIIIIITTTIVSYEHYILLISICLICVEYRLGLMMMGTGLTRWNTKIYQDGYTPTSRPQTTDKK